jgi:hypothetical protein
MMDPEDRELFRRSLEMAAEGCTGGDLTSDLEALGWAEALQDDWQAATETLFAVQGAFHLRSNGLDLLLLDALAAGRTVGEVGWPLWPGIGSAEPPGRLAGGEVELAALGSAAALSRDSFLVVSAGEGGPIGYTVSPDALELRAVEGMDPDLGLVEVCGSAEVLAELGRVDWSTAVFRARLVLELAREHAVERVQFGKPIAKFQAVRHRLAETLVAIEGAQAAVDVAWVDEDALAAAAAKALAGRSVRTAARHCQQVLAGIGFTTEHDFHEYLRRALVLDGLFGASRRLTRQFGEEVVATREPPPLLPL